MSELLDKPPKGYNSEGRGGRPAAPYKLGRRARILAICLLGGKSPPVLQKLGLDGEALTCTEYWPGVAQTQTASNPQGVSSLFLAIKQLHISACSPLSSSPSAPPARPRCLSNLLRAGLIGN